MKLSQLPYGARFEYKGMVLTKTGPMTAASEKGGQHFIPRFAVLKPVDGESPPPSHGDAGTLSVRTVRAAFEAYHATALRLADESGKMQLTAARARFLASLE